jgi:enamine deaminase RidA (YjgF/YER057c/UK114 family)
MTANAGAVRVMSERLSTPIGNFVHAVEVPSDSALLFLSGMTSRGGDGGVVHVGNAAEQTRRILQNMLTLLDERGLTLTNVVKITVYVKNMADLDEIHRVRREFFTEDFPASTLVEVSQFVHPDMLIEIDSIAYVPTAR